MSARLAPLILLYFVSYTAFAALTKRLSDPISIMPTSIAAGAAAWAVYLTISGNWRRHRFDGPALAAGVGGAAILTASTVAYSLRGVSIILPLLLMKGGVLLLAPMIDRAGGAQVSRRSMAVLALASCGVAAAAAPKLKLDGTAAALACAMAYLTGYALKLRAIGQRRGDWSFFLAETTITLALALVGSLVACALAGRVPSSAPLAALAGIASQACGVFGGLILLAPGRGHAALVPLNRCSSTLAGVAATLLIGGSIGPWEAAGAACMLAALWVGAGR